MSVEAFATEVVEGEIVENLLGMSPADMYKHVELQPSTLDEARSRSERIRAGLVLYVHTRAAIAEAWARRDWKVLGYDNWDAYLKGEFGDELRRLTGTERREAVAEYRQAGMSTRAIASAVQAPQSTVADDVRQLTGSGQLPETVKGLDGRDKPAKREPKPANASPGDSPAAPAPPMQGKPVEEKPAGRRSEAAPMETEVPRKKLADSPQARDEGARNAIRNGVQAFLPAINGITAERFNEIADDDLWLVLDHCRVRFIEWCDEVYAIRRRQSMRAVKEGN